VVLAPHYSAFSVETYNKRAKEEAEKYGISVKSVDDFYRQKPFIDYWVEQVEETMKTIPEDEHDKTAIIVSAHSLPEKMIVENNDPYPKQIERRWNSFVNVRITAITLQAGSQKVIHQTLG